MIFLMIYLGPNSFELGDSRLCLSINDYGHLLTMKPADLFHPKKVKVVAAILALKTSAFLAIGIANELYDLRSNLLTYECKKSLSLALKENGVANYKYFALNFCIGGNTSIDTKSLLNRR